MLPVALSLAGTGLRMPTVGYIGWFGPRGLASIVLALLVAEEHIPGVELLGRVVAVTVALSVLLHGVSAVALAERYGRWYGRTTVAAWSRPAGSRSRTGGPGTPPARPPGPPRGVDVGRIRLEPGP